MGAHAKFKMENGRQRYTSHSNAVTNRFESSTSSRSHRRIILKNGACNVFHSQSKRQKLDVLQFLKLVDYSWAFTLSVFMATLLLSWLGFAVLYWLICFTHGDFEPNHLPPFQNQQSFRPCIYDIYNFGSCLLFSIETQHTVGYGIKATTDECPEAIFVNAAQCLVGFVMQGIMAVVIFYKMTLPRHRQETLLFSKNAAICPKNEKLSLVFRIGDTRKNDIVEACIRAFFVRDTKTIEGETIINHQKELKLLFDGCYTDLFFNWPLVIYHVIDKTSPLYYFSPQDLAKDNFEIAVILEGTIETTGQMTQHRTSYVANEILWGQTFEPLLELNTYRKRYEVDLSKFDNLVPINTPLCSAAYFEEYTQMQKSKINVSSRIKLNFRPRHSIGDISRKTVEQLNERVKVDNESVKQNNSVPLTIDRQTDSIHN